MNFIACDGEITTDSTESFPVCASGWLVVPESVVVQSGSPHMTAAEFEYLHWGITILMVTAIGIRYILHVINNSGGRNA